MGDELTALVDDVRRLRQLREPLARVRAATDDSAALAAAYRRRHPRRQPAGRAGDAGGPGGHGRQRAAAGRPSVSLRRPASTLQPMFNVGGGELLVILLVALIVLGPQRLPDAARQVGRVMGDIRRISGGFQQELQDALRRRRGTAPGAPSRCRWPRRWPTPTTTPLRRAGRPRTTAPEPARRRGPSARSTRPTGDASSVAPAVADALDEIVAPARPAPVDPPADDAGDEGLGGERAASCTPPGAAAEESRRP